MKKLLFVNVLCVVAVIAIGVWVRLFKTRNFLIRFAKGIILHLRRYAAVYLISVLGVLTVISLYVRPLLIPADTAPSEIAYFNAHAMEQFLYFMPFVTLLFGIIGVAVFVQYKKLSSTLLLVFIGLASMGIYIFRPSITPEQIWAARRWVPVNYPFTALMASYGILYLFSKLRKKHLRQWGVVITVLAITVFSLYQARPFLFGASFVASSQEHVITGEPPSYMRDVIQHTNTALYNPGKQPAFEGLLEGYADGYARLAQIIPADSIVFIDEGHVASPIKYISERSTYLLDNYQPGLDKGILGILNDLKRPVYFLNRLPDFDDVNEITFSQTDTVIIAGHFLEKVFGEVPKNLYERNYILPVYKAAPAQEKVYYQLLPVPLFTVGEAGSPTVQNTVVSNGKGGLLLSRQNFSAKAGTYRLMLSHTLQTNPAGVLQVKAGEEVLAETALTGETTALTVTLPQAREGLVMEVHVNLNATIEIQTLTLEKDKE